jgi:hypothetical protein
MARQLHRLHSLDVRNATLPPWSGDKRPQDKLPDGGGLYLQLIRLDTETISRTWVFRFTLSGKTRWMGLGPADGKDAIGLADARDKAAQLRAELRDGIDPIEKRKKERAASAATAAKAITFDECRAAFIKAHRKGWKNAVHADQWESTLATYASPVLGGLDVRAIDTGLVSEKCWTRSGRRFLRRRGGCAGASSAYSIGARCVAIERATILRDGGGIWT